MITPPPTGARTGMPTFRPYRRGQSPAWAARVLAAAEAVHGPPSPTCVCGQPIHLVAGYATCPGCGYTTGRDGIHVPRSLSP